MQMYFTAIILPPELNEKIKVLKQWAYEGWGCKVGLKSPAHITLLPPFWMAPEMEAPFISDLDTLCSTIPAFPIATNNFSAFKPRTIFIDVVVDEALRQVKQQTDVYFKQRPQYGAKIDTRPFHPHITIATRDLRKSAFAEAWPQVENKPFIETFIAHGTGVLRHNGQAWDVIHTAPFTS